MASRKTAWTALKGELQRLSVSDLVGLVKDLCDRNDDNRSFVEARVNLGDLTPFKRRIRAGLYPDPVHGPPISIASARKAISDYRGAKGDSSGMLDLMLYYVECGTDMTLDYGDIDEAFYDSLESMFDRAVEALESADPDITAAYLPRAIRLVQRSEGIGWGYHDYLGDRLSGSFPEDM